MRTIRYTGEDIPVDITLKDDAGTLIDPSTLAGIKVYVVDQEKTVVLKGAYPAEAEYETLILSETFVRLWIPDHVTTGLAAKILHFEVAIYEDEAFLDDNIQTTIAVSDSVVIRDVQIKAEEQA